MYLLQVSQLVAFQGMVRIEKKTKIRQLTAVVKVTPDTPNTRVS